MAVFVVWIITKDLCKITMEAQEPDTAEHRPIHGTLHGNLIRVASRESAHHLSQDGYGDGYRGRYCLMPFEALYLMSIDRLRVSVDRRQLGFEDLLEMCQRNNPDTLSQYLIYRDLRFRGYVAKDGFGFGTDLRVYNRGDYGQKGAKLLVFGISEGKQISAFKFYKQVDAMTRMGKEPVVAVIERRGEIIYYKINKTEFADNHKSK